MVMEDKIEISKEIMDGLYKIMCGLSTHFSGWEVYPEAHPKMQQAQKFILEYGNKNNLDPRR